jgi:hypothetical protein
VAVQPPFDARDRPVGVRHNPWRRPLKHVELPALRLDVGHDLDRGSPRSNDGNPACLRDPRSGSTARSCQTPQVIAPVAASLVGRP